MINTKVCRLMGVQAARCSCIWARVHTRAHTAGCMMQPPPELLVGETPLIWGFLSAHSILPLTLSPPPALLKHTLKAHTRCLEICLGLVLVAE